MSTKFYTENIKEKLKVLADVLNFLGILIALILPGF